MIDFQITSPRHSLIQFVATDAEAQPDNCRPNTDSCMPIQTTDDISFQVFAEDVEVAPPDSQYVLRVIMSCDAEAEPVTIGEGTVIGSISWHLDSPNSRAIGYSDFDTPVDFANGFNDGECFTIGLYSALYTYIYADVDPAVGIEITVSVEVNGSPVNVGTFTCVNIDDLIGALNAEFGMYGDVFSLVSGGPGAGTIQVISNSGNVYSTLTVDDGRLNAYEPTISAEYTLKYCSGCFQYVSNACFTTVLKYKNDENAYGFEYEIDAAFYNKARMRLYLQNPQPVVDENVFRLSNGTRKTLSAVHSLAREGVVDYMGEAGHVALSIALKHDDLYLKDYPATAFTKFVSEGQYEINWQNRPGLNIDSAPGKFKVLETPYYEENVNCE